MRSPVTGIVGLFLLFVLVIVGYSSVFTVTQTEQALVVRLGRPVMSSPTRGCTSRRRSSIP